MCSCFANYMHVTAEIQVLNCEANTCRKRMENKIENGVYNLLNIFRILFNPRRVLITLMYLHIGTPLTNTTSCLLSWWIEFQYANQTYIPLIVCFIIQLEYKLILEEKLLNKRNWQLLCTYTFLFLLLGKFITRACI